MAAEAKFKDISGAAQLLMSNPFQTPTTAKSGAEVLTLLSSRPHAGRHHPLLARDHLQYPHLQYHTLLALSAQPLVTSHTPTSYTPTGHTPIKPLIEA